MGLNDDDNDVMTQLAFMLALAKSSGNGSGYILRNFASIEDSPAVANHITGDYVIYNSKLYKVTSPIAIGEDLVEDTNISRTSVATELTNQWNSVVGTTGSGAGYHNSVYRGSYLGDSVTMDQWNAISTGTFDGLFIGDYWTINGVNWRIAAFDYWLNSGDSYCMNHHVLIVPDTNLHNAKMNEENTTAGAYIGSDFYKGTNGNTGFADAKTKVNNAFGASHILSHRELLVTEVTNGYASAWAWRDSSVELMNENMVFGSPVWRTPDFGNGHEIGIDDSQLPLFALDHSRIYNRDHWWLRSVASDTNFASVDSNGFANHRYAYVSLGIRPVFGIK